MRVGGYSSAYRENLAMGDQPLETCLILAPLSVDTSPLRAKLSARGVRSREESALVTAGSFHSAALVTAIADVDFVCSVLPAGAVDPNVLVEIGMAVAKDRPLLLFVAPKVELPMVLRGRPYARASLRDREALDFHLDAFLKNAGRNGDGVESVPVNDRAHLDSVALRAALDQVTIWELGDTAPGESELVEFLSRLFEATGLVASTTRRSTTHGTHMADIAVWVDELEAVVGNPLLVEVVGRSPHTRPNARRFQQLLAENQTSLGVLVRWGNDDDRDETETTRWPIVVNISVRELVEMLGQGRFGQTLLERRHSAVHLVP